MDPPDRPIEPSDDEVDAAHPEITRQATSIRMIDRVHISQPPIRRSRGPRTAAVSPTRPAKTRNFEGSVAAAADEGASARIAVTVPSKNEARPSRKVRLLTVCSQARKTTPQRRRLSPTPARAVPRVRPQRATMMRSATTGVESSGSLPRTRRPRARMVHSPGWSTVKVSSWGRKLRIMVQASAPEWRSYGVISMIRSATVSS